MAPSTTSTHLSPAELSYLHTSLSSHPPIRPDARLPTDFRPLNAETGVLPNTMGSAHVGFADGREAVVGVRAEVEKTRRVQKLSQENSRDVAMQEASAEGLQAGGQAEWVSLSLTLPGLRDDDKDLVFLEEMLREALVTPSPVSTALTDKRGPQSLQDALVINARWHWHLYIDVLLITPPNAASTSSGSSGSSANYPLPLLSMAIHVALRDTKIPRLKSEGEEDPVADDDWDAAVPLYTQTLPTQVPTRGQALLREGSKPPVTLLVMAVGENVIFDPSAIELSVADGVWAVSVGYSSSSRTPTQDVTAERGGRVKVLGIRTLETPARDTMRGVPRDMESDDTNHASAQAAGYDLGAGTDQTIPGVWKPKVGGVKRMVIMKVMKAVLGKNDDGVGAEVLSGLDGFLTAST